MAMFNSYNFIDSSHSAILRKIYETWLAQSVKQSTDIKRKRAASLIDKIQFQGARAYEYLYRVVLDEELYEAADILKPENAPHEFKCLDRSRIESEDDLAPDDSLPTSWPTDENKNICVQMIEEQHTKMTTLFHKTVANGGQEGIYLMSSKPRGHVLIISNETFRKMNKRKGTSKDVKDLEKLFKGLHFDVNIAEDKTKEEMWKLLAKESQDEYHMQANCFVLFILSHGNTGLVYGTDGICYKERQANFIEIKKIIELFSRSKFLKDKPKLFFIQACQGVKENTGEAAGATDDKEGAPKCTDTALQNKHSSPTCSATDSPGDGSGQSNKELQEKIIVDTRNFLKNLIPDTESDSAMEMYGSDIFVAMATIPDFISLRNKKLGSWFIQAVVYVFAKFAFECDLGKLMTMLPDLWDLVVEKLYADAENLEKRTKFIKKSHSEYNHNKDA